MDYAPNSTAHYANAHSIVVALTAKLQSALCQPDPDLKYQRPMGEAPASVSIFLELDGGNARIWLSCSKIYAGEVRDNLLELVLPSVKSSYEAAAADYFWDARTRPESDSLSNPFRDMMLNRAAAQEAELSKIKDALLKLRCETQKDRRLKC
jgi:hypothetical protein